MLTNINLEAPKTKTIVGLLKSLNASNKKLMFVSPEYNDNVTLSLRNIPTVLGTLLSDVNTYDIVNSEVLVLTESAAKVFAGAEEAEAA